MKIISCRHLVDHFLYPWYSLLIWGYFSKKKKKKINEVLLLIQKIYIDT